MSCKCKFNNCDQFEYCCYHKDLIDEKPRETNDQLQINFVMATTRSAKKPDQLKQQEPKQPGPTSPPTNDLFDRLKKEIEDTQKENAINLMDNEIIDQKIKNSKLQNN
ncbi:2458_t:CDS:2 [Gigaspora margarita]|uniref:2458_t:CDS:1 n=1 Tax=Gigaspora margarita TaxID=4874 RepID=A0ABN7W5A5_GIGMA|nr:2458_t:CDS:2 [Gigaspora margarita]